MRTPEGLRLQTSLWTSKVKFYYRFNGLNWLLVVCETEVGLNCQSNEDTTCEVPTGYDLHFEIKTLCPVLKEKGPSIRTYAKTDWT